MATLTKRITVRILTPLLVGLALCAAGPAPVQLKPSAALSSGLDAFPRIVATPDAKAAERINQALARRDSAVLNAAKDCRTNSDKPDDAQWSRTISVTMRGPLYLSLVAYDSWSCGGAHDDSSILVLVYDLTTGSPVDWARLLPSSMLQGTSTDTTGDGTSIGVISSRALQDLYLKGEKAPDPECRDALKDPGLKFSLWPDAKGDGIAIQTQGLPHVVAACGADSIVIPTATMRKLGVNPALLDAIDTAHSRGWFERDKK